jgi:hypothetical protein
MRLHTPFDWDMGRAGQVFMQGMCPSLPQPILLVAQILLDIVHEDDDRLV